MSDDPINGKLPWDAECDATRAGMERFLRALVCTGSHFSDSFHNHPVSKPCRQRVYFRVWITVGSELRFLAMAGVDELKPPPRVDLGWSSEQPEAPKENPRQPIRRSTP